MRPPPIDPRDRDALVAQTTALAQRFSEWRPPASGSDLGTALIGVFGRFAELVVEQLNEAPQRGYLAFLDLIGAQPLPPRPARVPLTFALAEGAGAAVLVPAGTGVAAPATDEIPEESVFETEDPVMLSPARLRAVFVIDPTTGLFSDRTASAGTVAEPFSVFEGDRTPPHHLYLASPLFNDQGTRELELRFGIVRSQQWDPEEITWSAWDGQAFSAITPSATSVDDRTARVTFTGPPVIPPSEVNGVTGHWLRLESAAPIPSVVQGGPPLAVAAGRRVAGPMQAGFAPFGQDGQAKYLYLALEPPKAPGAGVQLAFMPSAGENQPGHPVNLAWSYRSARGWQPLGTSDIFSPPDPASPFAFVDESFALTNTPGLVRFTAPRDWAGSTLNAVYGHWLRIELADPTQYRTLPVLAEISVLYSSPVADLAALSIVQRAGSAAAVPVEQAFAGDLALDVTKDFLPFGAEPAFGDTFYLACPAAAYRPGSPITATLTLRNPKAPGTGSPQTVPERVTESPELAWEAWDGSAWQAVAAAPASSFTSSGVVRLVPGRPIAESQVGGRAGLWLRARVLGGAYGKPARYTYNPTTTAWTPEPSTICAPMVQSLTFAPVTEVQGPPSAAVTLNEDRWRTEWVGQDHQPPTGFTPFTASADHDPAMLLGFDRPFRPSPVTLFLPLEPPLPQEMAADLLMDADPYQAPAVVWEYSVPDGWQQLVVRDGTGSLTGRGTVQFLGPAGIAPRTIFGVTAYWVRVRLDSGEFLVDPRISGVLPDTVWASQVVSVSDEVLGSGTGAARQTMAAGQAPVLPGQQVAVRESTRPTADDDGTAEVWVRWQQVPDFHGSGPADRHYTCDSRTGRISFGDGQAGRLLPLGQNNVRITYRSGGGPAGNRPPGTITELRTSVPSVDSVVNHQAATGGAPPEPTERVAERGPQFLRHRDRALAVQDLEDLAYAASTGVARAKAVPALGYDPFDLWLDPRSPVLLPQHTAVVAGRAGVIIVPASAELRPTPSLGLLRDVREYLAARTCATAALWVSGPEWIRVTVSAAVVPGAREVPDLVAERVRARLVQYLHPLTGGTEGRGWAFGRKPHRSDLLAVTEGVPGVDDVPSLTVLVEPESEDLQDRLTGALNRPLVGSARQPLPADLQRWLGRALVYSGPHAITTTWSG